MTYWSLLSGLDLLSSQLLVSRGHSPNDHGKLKNFFGRYTDPSLKALSALVALYVPTKLFLAEGARILSQSVKYDIPLLKKSLGATLKMQEDLRNKIQEESRSLREARRKLTESLANTWNIHSLTPHNLESQIRARAEVELPVLLNEIITQSQQSKFGESLEYYREFVKFCLQGGQGGSGAGAASSSAAAAAVGMVFPSLQALRTSELMPLVSESSSAPSASASATGSASAAAASEGGIDWGISVDGSGDSAGGASGEIDWGITSDGAGDATTTATAGSIDWGDDSSSAAQTDGAAATINWDIETTEAGEEDSASTTSTAPSQSTAASSESAGSASTSSSAAPSSATSLLNDSFRHAVLAELLELEGFLSERSLDLSASEGQGDEAALAAFAVSGVPHILSLQSSGTVGGYLAAVRAVLSSLRAQRLTQLLMVRSSRRYMDRLVSGLKQSIAGLERMDRSQVSHEARRAELAKSSQRSAHELQVLVGQCRTLKAQVESEISKLFQNRPVHLVGEINQMLQATS